MFYVQISDASSVFNIELNVCTYFNNFGLLFLLYWVCSISDFITDKEFQKITPLNSYSVDAAHLSSKMYTLTYQIKFADASAGCYVNVICAQTLVVRVTETQISSYVMLHQNI